MLVKEQCRFSFSQRTINEWNISTDCVNGSSVSMFKTKLSNISEGRVTHR